MKHREYQIARQQPLRLQFSMAWEIGCSPASARRSFQRLCLNVSPLHLMRVLRIAPLIVAVLLTTLFGAYYIKTVRWLLDGGLETGGSSFPRVCYDLRNDIDVIVWRAFPQSRPLAHDGWRLFHYGDAPEGTTAVVYFPSWYLLIRLAAFWGYAVFATSIGGLTKQT